jgi:signal peptidase I
MDQPEGPGAVRNPYEVLGVSPDASQEEIRDAYWRLVRFHRTEGESAWTATHLGEIQDAYDLLSDPARRAALDAGNGDAPSSAPPPVPPSFQPGPPALPAPQPEQPSRRSRNPIDRLTHRLPRPWRIAVDWIVTIAGAVLIVLAIKAWVINPYRIPSSSMEPTLHCARPAPFCEARFSDRVLANRFIYHFRDPERGEIVVFKTTAEVQRKCNAGGTFVKRIIGLPGDKIENRLIHGKDYVFINGKQLDEPYIQPNRRSADPTKSYSVPPDQYFMMGDNRASSCDSRSWGSLPRENIIGKVFMTYWPPNRISFR